MDKKAIIKALRDTAQSASNTASEAVSGPVDLIAAGLRKAGVKVPENAIGSSQWMEENGVTKPVEKNGYEAAGRAIGMIAPIMAGGKAAKLAK
jgi:hypothetical protein